MLAGGVDDAHLLALRKAPRYSFGMRATIIVFLGAGPDGAARYGLNLIVTWMMCTGFPFGILFVNLLGCLRWASLRGGLPCAARLARACACSCDRRAWRLYDLLGIRARYGYALGAQRAGPAALYVLLSVLGSLAALGAGLAVARAIA